MFVRTVETRSGSKTHRYLRVVENYRADGKVKQRVILNLGNLEKIRPGLPAIARALGRYSGTKLFTLKEISCEKVREYGNILLLRKLWKDLEIERAFHAPPFPGGAAYIMVMVFHRLLRPGGNLTLGQWLKRVYLPIEPQADTLPPRLERPPTSKKMLELLRYVGKENVQKESFKGLKDFYKGNASYCFIFRLPALTGKIESKESLLALLMAGDIPRAFTLYGGKADSDFIREISQKLRSRRAIFVSHGLNLRQGVLNFLRKRGMRYIVFYRVRKSAVVDDPLFKRKRPSTWRVKVKRGKGQRLYIIYNNSFQRGKPYCIFKTNIPGPPSAPKVIRAYRGLLEGENALSELTPPGHALSHEGSRIGYVWICLMAYALKKILEKRLLQGGLEMTPLELLEGLRDIKLVTTRVAGVSLNSLTRITRRDKELLRTFGIRRLGGFRHPTI